MPTSANCHDAELLDREVGHVDVDHHGIDRHVVDQRLSDGLGDGGRAVPVLRGDRLVPALTLDAEAGDRLADRDAGDAAVAAGEGGTDGARVIDGTTHVGAGVDAADDQVERRPERAEPGEHDAQRRWPADLPDRVGGAVVDVASAHLGLDQVQGSERGARTRELLVGSDDVDLVVAVELADRAGQHVQTDRVDAVVVRHQDAHGLHPRSPVRLSSERKVNDR